MTKIYDFIYKVLLVMMISMLVIMVATVSINVFARFYGGGFSWIEEVSNLAFVWMAFTAIALGLRYNIHPGFDLVLEKSSYRIKKVLMITVNVLILCFILYAFKGGIDYAIKSSIQRTAILDISVSWKYAAIPFSTFFMALETLRKLVLICKNDMSEIKNTNVGVL